MHVQQTKYKYNFFFFFLEKVSYQYVSMFLKEISSLFSNINTKIFRSIKLTSDLGGEVGRVTRYEQLQLLIKVTASEIQIPGSNSCQGGEAE